MTAMAYDVARVRESFPALKEGAAHFDGPGGSQVPVQVGDAIAETITAAIANRGTVTAAEQRADSVVADARRAIADLLGASPEGVVFGRSMTQLTYDIARALAKQWSADDEVVVTRLDHDANIRPWVRAAEVAGATVHWAPFDQESGQLGVDAVAELLSDRTRVVALTGASNLLGSRPDVRAIADAAHAHGALVYVDGVHLTPHAPVDMVAMGADFYVCSPYKFLGPHLGALAADPSLLATIEPDKLLPATNDVPERFELGTLPYELLAGTTAAVDFLAGLAPRTDVASDGDRRARLVTSMTSLADYEEGLFATLLAGLRGIEGVTLHGSPDRRTPTALFSVAGRTPQEVYERLALDGVNAPGGNFYALEAARWLGLGDDGAVRAGLAPYTDATDIERLVTAVAACARA
jgi:cysteine desulfurase family protein (TIGR01976 family)